MATKAIYKQEQKYKVRCDTYGCRKIAEHYIGHPTHQHTGQRLCHTCFESILADMQKFSDEAVLPNKLPEKKAQEPKHKIVATKFAPESYYWNTRSNLTRLRRICQQRGIAFKESDIRRTLMEYLREADPGCEVAGDWND